MAKVLFVIYVPDEEENPLTKKKETSADPQKGWADKVTGEASKGREKASAQDGSPQATSAKSLGAATSAPSNLVQRSLHSTEVDADTAKELSNLKPDREQSTESSGASKSAQDSQQSSVHSVPSGKPSPKKKRNIDEDATVALMSEAAIKERMKKDDFWDMDTESTPITDTTAITTEATAASTAKPESRRTEPRDDTWKDRFMNLLWSWRRKDDEEEEDSDEAPQEIPQASAEAKGEQSQLQRQGQQQPPASAKQNQTQPPLSPNPQIAAKPSDDKNDNRLIKPNDAAKIFKLEPVTDDITPVQVLTKAPDEGVIPDMGLSGSQPSLQSSDVESYHSCALGSPALLHRNQSAVSAVEKTGDEELGGLTPLVDMDKDKPPPSSRKLKDKIQLVLAELGVKNISWQKCQTTRVWQVVFVADSGIKCENIMEELQILGVGKIKRSSISVLPITVHSEALETPEKEDQATEKDNEDLVPSEEMEQAKEILERKSEFKESIKSRLLVQQVVDSVESNARFTFDYLMLVILAGIIAALGLVENSSVVLVASMLISPLMGPILAGTFGFVIENVPLRRLGLVSEIIGLTICIITGFVCGLVAAALEAGGIPWRSTDAWPTAEMTSRGVARGLIVGVLIALPSGAGVALSVLGGNTGSLVGVAISASLLPPAVNAGMLWSNALITAFKSPKLLMQQGLHSVFNGTHNITTSIFSPVINENGMLGCPQIIDNEYTRVYVCDAALDSFILGLISLTLTILNITCIFIMGIIILKIKEVVPHKTSSTLSAQEFFGHDIKVARDSYKTTKGAESAQLGRQFLQEYMALKAQEELDTISEASETLEFQEILEEVEDSVNRLDISRQLPTTSPPPKRYSELLGDTFQRAAIAHSQKHPEQVYLTIQTSPGQPVPHGRRVSFSEFKSPSRIELISSSTGPTGTPALAAITEDSVTTPVSTSLVDRRGARLRVHIPMQHVSLTTGRMFHVTQVADAKSGSRAAKDGSSASQPQKVEKFADKSKNNNADTRTEEAVGERCPLLESDPKVHKSQADTHV